MDEGLTEAAIFLLLRVRLCIANPSYLAWTGASLEHWGNIDNASKILGEHVIWYLVNISAEILVLSNALIVVALKVAFIGLIMMMAFLASLGFRLSGKPNYMSFFRVRVFGYLVFSRSFCFPVILLLHS